MMFDYWTTVGEVADVFDGPHATPKKIEEGPYFLSISSLENGKLDLSKSARLGEKDFIKWTQRITPMEGDVLFSYETRLGEAALMPPNIRACLGRRMGLLRPKLDKVTPEYLLYAYLSPAFQNTILSRTVHGCTVDRIALKDLPNFPIWIPPKKEQKEAVAVLKALDSKIALNTQTNQTLEAIAQAIFKSWFVDFEPLKAKMAVLEAGGTTEEAERAAMCAISGKDETALVQLKTEQPDAYAELAQTAALFPAAMQESELGEIPEGWEVVHIDDVCDFQNGYAFKSKEMSKSSEDAYKVFKMGGIKKGGGLNKAGTKDYYDRSKCKKLGSYVLKKGDLLMCMTDMKNNVALLGHTALMDVDDEYILNQRVGLLRSKNIVKANYPFLYILTNSESFIEDLRSRANSGVQVNLSTKEIKETQFILPSEGVHLAFDKIAVKQQEQIFSLEAEQECFSKLRDLLLPKLLSGEIDLSQAADIADEVSA